MNADGDINPNHVIALCFNFMLIATAPIVAVVITFVSRMPFTTDGKNITIFATTTFGYIVYLLLIFVYGQKAGFKSTRYYSVISFVIFISVICFLWNGIISAAMGI